MPAKSAIEWTDTTWNPVTGCTKVSPGCKLCYAEKLSARLKAMGRKKYRNGFKLTLHEDVIEQPLRWKKPRTIFVNSMSDLFHEDIPFGFIDRIFQTMQKAHWHQFQILTKRSERLQNVSWYLPRLSNVWTGVSVENDDFIFRIDHLRQTPVAVKFLSLEPLLGPLHWLDLGGIDWVIVGGESGSGARPMDLDWARSIRNQCAAANVPFFMKQITRNGRKIPFRDWPEDLQARRMPGVMSGGVRAR